MILYNFLFILSVQLEVATLKLLDFHWCNCKDGNFGFFSFKTHFYFKIFSNLQPFKKYIY